MKFKTANMLTTCHVAQLEYNFLLRLYCFLFFTLTSRCLLRILLVGTTLFYVHAFAPLVPVDNFRFHDTVYLCQLAGTSHLGQQLREHENEPLVI